MSNTTTEFVASNFLPRGTATASAVNCTGSENCTSNIDDVIWQPAVIQRVATIVVSMVFALVGNTVIIMLLTCSRYRKRNSRVNIFIIHLAIGDLTVCSCTMTTEILFVAFGQWVLGPALCKILTYLQCVTLASTTFILTSMSFDRYLAICKPLKYRATTARAKRFIAFSWVLAFILAIPQLLIFVQTQEEKDGKIYLHCKSKGYTAHWQRMLYFSFLTCYVFVVPTILISFCYISIVWVVSKASRVVQNTQNNYSLRRSTLARSKSTFPRAKIKTLKMTFAIIATFIVCWTPYFVTTLIRIYSNYNIEVPEAVMAFAETIAFTQSAFNPLIYGCFNIKIKRGISDFFCPHTEKLIRRSPSYRSPGLCMSVTSTQAHHHRPVYEMKLCANNTRLRENYSNNLSKSSSGNSLERLGRGNSSVVTVTEENKNGVRLRVRFASKEHSRCLSSDGLEYCNTDISGTYDVLQQNNGTNSKMPIYKHHSLQQLYK